MKEQHTEDNIERALQNVMQEVRSFRQSSTAASNGRLSELESRIERMLGRLSIVESSVAMLLRDLGEPTTKPKEPEPDEPPMRSNRIPGGHERLIDKLGEVYGWKWPNEIYGGEVRRALSDAGISLHSGQISCLMASLSHDRVSRPALYKSTGTTKTDPQTRQRNTIYRRVVPKNWRRGQL